MTNDMTAGKPAGLIIRFMLPVCLGNIFQQVYNLTDSVIAGRYLGVDGLAAIGSTGSLVFLVLGALMGITSGFAILISQCFGARKYDEMRNYYAVSICLCVVIVILMTGILLWMNYPILRLINAPEDLIDEIAGYMGVIYVGLAVTTAYNLLAAILRALGDSKSPLYFLVISAVLNIFLDILFIVVFHTGVIGTAYATVIAQGISALLCLVYVIKKFPILKLNRSDFSFSWQGVLQLLRLGIPMGLQFSITAIGGLIVQGAINVYGSEYIAGYSAAGKIQNIITTVFISFGTAIATYAGQNYGAGKIERVRQGVKITQVMVLIWSVVTMVLINLIGPFLVLLFVTEPGPGVLESAMTYFKTVFWLYPMLGSIFVYRNALQGLGYSMVPMLGGVFELVARAGVIFLLAGNLGFQGVCLADPMAWAFALIPLVPYYLWIVRRLGKAG